MGPRRQLFWRLARHLKYLRAVSMRAPPPPPDGGLPSAPVHASTGHFLQERWTASQGLTLPHLPPPQFPGCTLLDIPSPTTGGAGMVLAVGGQCRRAGGRGRRAAETAGKNHSSLPSVWAAYRTHDILTHALRHLADRNAHATWRTRARETAARAASVNAPSTTLCGVVALRDATVTQVTLYHRTVCRAAVHLAAASLPTTYTKHATLLHSCAAAG